MQVYYKLSTYQPLIQALSKHFPMHPARLRTLIGTILGLVSGSNVHHHTLARCLDSTTHEAATKRVERFFKEQGLCIKKYALAIVDLLQFSGKFDLCLDRSNWENGNKQVNYLVLSWRISDKISLPLLAVELDKAGNSNTQERTDLIQMFIDLFGANRIGGLTADREFVGDKWIRFLIDHRIPFFIRTKNNLKIPWGDGTCDAKCFMGNWDEKRPRKLEKEMFGTTVYFAFKKLEKGELLIIMTNQDLPVGQILAVYKDRWSIETLFKNLKTGGFNWENTHMKDSNRLLKLLIILGLAALFAYMIGSRTQEVWRRTVNRPLHSCFKRGLRQFQYLLSQARSHALSFLNALLPLLPSLIPKSVR